MSELSTDALHMTSPLRVGQRVGRTIYAQLGPEPSDIDPLVATADSPVLAERIVRAVNEVDGRELDEVADPCMEDAHGTCHAPGHNWHENQRRRSSSPATDTLPIDSITAARLVEALTPCYEPRPECEHDDEVECVRTAMATVAAPTPAPLQPGDVVTGDRAVSAPVGTTLGAKSAALAAVHTVNGWSVTGLGREQDHEHAVRINEWVVLVLPDGTPS